MDTMRDGYALLGLDASGQYAVLGVGDSVDDCYAEAEGWINGTIKRLAFDGNWPSLKADMQHIRATHLAMQQAIDDFGSLVNIAVTRDDDGLLLDAQEDMRIVEIEEQVLRAIGNDLNPRRVTN